MNGEEIVIDPVCGMPVQPGNHFVTTYRGHPLRFCSELCQRNFLAEPDRYTPISDTAPGHRHDGGRRIAYFTMEVAVDARIPTYSGGLGVLAGDTLRSCADLRLPVVAVSLLYANGYFEQRLDESGNQRELPVAWNRAELLTPLPASVRVSIEGRSVVVQAWQYNVLGVSGWQVPLILLDTDVVENQPADRQLTAWLYGGDLRYRLAQESVLGVAGVRMLRALGYNALQRFHMNEGHASLLTLELLRERSSGTSNDWDFGVVRESCVFTTHTPVEAGHDRFTYDLVDKVLERIVPLELLQMLGGRECLNMTLLGLNMSHYVNGVAKRHGEVSQGMFPGHQIDSITNGIHSATWTCDSFRALYDRHVPGWRNDPSMLRHAMSIPGDEVWGAHIQAKERLLAEVARRTGRLLDKDALTLGFARRAATYKRSELVLSDSNQLRTIAQTAGRIQLIFAGKAHPRDEPGKESIRRIFRAARELKRDVSIVYLENYDLELASLLIAGSDVWLNTPLRPQEASGTSGMKAAHNGVPSLSILDGWWIEGHIEGVTGWSIGESSAAETAPEQFSAKDSADLYSKLRERVVPTFYHDRERWLAIMRQTIAFNASFFNTHRMVQQYAANAYV